VAFRGLPEGDRGRDSLFQHAAGSAARAVAVSRAVLSGVCEAAPELTSRSSVIYNAAPEPAIAPSALPFAAPRLLCLGRLVEEKRFALAVDAMPRVLEEFPQAILVIAGDGPERAALEAQVSDLGLASATRFLGWVMPPQVPALLNRTTALLMPSRTEGCPNVAIQAAFMCRPVIGMRVGGLPEVVRHAETGFLLGEHDGAALGDAICALLREPGDAVRMGEAARTRARRLFDWQRHVDAYEALYQKAV
jgi:glycosyltransferase involved in cell wall biosynthesis